MKSESRFVWCFLLVLLASFALADDSAVQSTWKIGTAKAKITPQKASWMSGYAARTHPA